MFGPFSFLIFFMINKYLEQVPSNLGISRCEVGRISIFRYKGPGKIFKIFYKKVFAILNSNLITIVTNENCTDSSSRSTAFEASLIFILKRKSKLEILI